MEPLTFVADFYFLTKLSMEKHLGIDIKFFKYVVPYFKVYYNYNYYMGDVSFEKTSNYLIPTLINLIMIVQGNH